MIIITDMEAMPPILPIATPSLTTVFKKVSPPVTPILLRGHSDVREIAVAVRNDEVSSTSIRMVKMMKRLKPAAPSAFVKATVRLSRCGGDGSAALAGEHSSRSPIRTHVGQQPGTATHIRFMIWIVVFVFIERFPCVFEFVSLFDFVLTARVGGQQANPSE